ncbi:NADH dehydrogenase [uncultured Synechococcales cyanobacterium]|uniref:NADH dehydrogenase n=1 Tax=uncultured Synechococcales cyanobacterium TaxID=1936017 RepID=A0A6J4V4P6_9CYAN|nr:NADH dehydrogenase [uncultured Synechococcales cyanobacterium]
MTSPAQTVMGLQESIEQRRAARAFKSDPIPEEILKEILRLGVRAPSGYNLQPWRFILVRQQENKYKLKACAFDQPQIGQAPVVLICCGYRDVAASEYIESVIQIGTDFSGLNDQYAGYVRSAIPSFFENHPSFSTLEAWTNRHTMIAVAHIMIVAKSFGVDSCPMEGFIASQVKEAFNIPQNVDVCCLLPIGYATEPLKDYGGRFPVEQVCFGESYGESL